MLLNAKEDNSAKRSNSATTVPHSTKFGIIDLSEDRRSSRTFTYCIKFEVLIGSSIAFIQLGNVRIEQQQTVT